MQTMNHIKFETDANPSRQDIQKLADGLNHHATESVGSRGFDSTAIWVKNNDGEIVGGVQALINWNWLHICLIWLDESLRKQGVGTELLNRIEALGRASGCTHAHLDTFSFQARGFYEKHGFRVFGNLEDYPPGHNRYYLYKSLNA